MLRLLVALDLSDASPLTLHTAMEVALRAPSAEVHVLTVIAAAHDDVATMSAAEQACDALRRMVEVERSRHAATDGVRMHFSAQACGAPAETIVAHAHAIAADVILVGTHGRRGIDRIVLGSVAEAVVRQAPCSVLTVKPRPPRGAQG